MDKRKKEFVIFVVLVLMISWVPMMLSNPLPENALPAELLENPYELFPDISGYSKVNISSSFSKYAPVLEADYVVAYTYTSESSYKPVWVLIQKASKPKSFHGPKVCYTAQKWNIEEDNKAFIGNTTAVYFLAEKKGARRAVAYWYFTILEKKLRFFVFYLPKDIKDIVFIRVETPYDEDARSRIDEVGRAMLEQVNRKIEGA